ncbi:MAG: glutamate-1-semialdehyde 2,1-aminomutase [Planctomycetota bacterium]
MTRNAELFARAGKVLPGGVNSPVRAFRAVGGNPPYIVRASGARMTDADGREYIDLVGSWGPMIVGHAHPAVRNAIADALDHGTSFGACSPAEVDLAERVVARVPSVEVVRMTSSGTEATMAAVRLARAATGRSHIIKFDGCYHGHSDSLLQAAGSGVATLDLPDALGIPGAVSQLTLQAAFNDIEGVAALFAAHEGKVAAVIVEPVPGNMGVVPPRDGFLERLRELCTTHGAVLIFDEVMTGFRLARGGWQEACGVMPDLTTMGKVIGGGLPVGAFGGRRELMQQIAPAGGVYHAGTLSGNPLAMAAGCATLDLLDAAAYTRLEAAGARLQEHLERGLRDANVKGLVQRVGSMITLFFTDRTAPIREFADAKACNTARFPAWFRAMLDAGVYLPPSQFEAWFLSTAHDDATIDAIGEAHVRALQASS